VIAASVLFAVTIAQAPADLCTLCHPDVRVQFERGIHATEEVACVSCHGGDSAAATVEAAHRGDFRGSIPRIDVPGLCASCHANTERMSPYNLPTDQYALFQTSRHGRALARGDVNGAVCTDCHGTHEIFRSDDSRSRVYPANIPGTCAKCHSDAGLMSGYGLTGGVHDDYVAGVHGEALLERQIASAPECSRCHGAHGAAPPGVGNINKVCGQCHATVRAHYRDSPHKLALDRAGLPECASCHGNHRVLKTDVDMLDSSCSECHESGSAATELALQMKTLFTAASNDVEAARRQVERAAAIPLYLEDYRARLEEANTSLMESLPAMHALDLDRIQELTGRARSIGHEIESELRGKLEGRKWRKVGLAVFWFYLLVTVAILIRFRRRASRVATS
jgi:predicted CXXCH cytochrome family protein